MVLCVGVGVVCVMVLRVWMGCVYYILLFMCVCDVCVMLYVMYDVVCVDVEDFIVSVIDGN